VVYAVCTDCPQLRAETDSLKAKVRMYLSTSLRHIGGVEVYSHSLLTSALDGGELSTSRPGRFTPEKVPSYPSKNEAGWVPVPELTF